MLPLGMLKDNKFLFLGLALVCLAAAPKISAQEVADKDKKILPRVELKEESPESKPFTSSSPFSFTQFQLGPIVALQGNGASTSLLLRYLPEYSFGSFGLGLDFGLSGFKNTGTRAFTVGEMGAQGSYRFNPSWGARLLLGLQSWSGNNGVAFFAGPQAEYYFCSDRPSWLEGVYLAYDAVFQSTRAHLISAGITLKF